MPLPQTIRNIPARENSDVVEAAAKKLGARVAVLITTDAAEKFDARIYGSTAAQRGMASLMVDAAFKGLDEYAPNAAGDGVEREQMTSATLDVLAERRRQVEVEGLTVEHDDQHTDMSLAQAALAYTAVSLADPCERAVMDEFGDFGSIPFRLLDLWPKSWAAMWFKPKNRRRDLVRAAALILAEIERLDRAAARAAAKKEVDHG